MKPLSRLDIERARRFGHEVIDKEDPRLRRLKSFAPPSNDDGAIITGRSDLFHSMSTDIDATRIQNENALIVKYRDMVMAPEIDKAVDDIVNEIVEINEDNDPITPILDHIEGISNTVKDAILDEWTYLLRLFNFRMMGYDICRKWYVDGKVYYHLIIDFDHPDDGIQEVRFIDPLNIRKIREAVERPTPTMGMGGQIQPQFEEYYVYSELGIDSRAQGLRITKDSVAYAHSGLVDAKSGTVLSYLHKAIKPYNQLRMLEDATVIYRIARAPERRAFYVDIAGLPAAAAERHMEAVIQRYKNKLSYDISTGDVTNERRYMTMLQDYFLPQREGKGTQIDTLQGGHNLGEMEDVNYFRRKLYESLNIPVSRLEDNNAFNIGRPSEITRDEVKYGKFIKRLRTRFVAMFEFALQQQLILKKIIAPEEWRLIKEGIRYDFMGDNFFFEMKDAEIWTNRLTQLKDFNEFTTEESGSYFSKEWIRRNVLRQTDDQIDDIKKQVKKEKAEFPPQLPGFMDDGAGPMPQDGNPASPFGKPASPFGKKKGQTDDEADEDDGADDKYFDDNDDDEENDDKAALAAKKKKDDAKKPAAKKKPLPKKK